MSGTHEPLSWLTLERYALGELDERERADVEARLLQSEADRAILAAIQSDQSVLPELPASATGGATVDAIGSGAKRKVGRVWTFASTSLAAAAALLLWRALPEDPTGQPYEGVKGSEFALLLISDRNGAAPKAFRAGERFKVEITCPVSHRAALRVLVFQGEETFEPLPARAVRCGNLVAFPGAFSLDGSEAADVCLYSGVEPSPGRGAPGLVCTRLEAN